MMKKPKFGIVVAVTQSPMAKAYKKAMDDDSYEEKSERPKGKMPVAPKGEKDKRPKSRMPVAPKSGKPPTKPRRSGKEM